MIKGVLIDLGNTIWHNCNPDFKKALKVLYELNNNHQVSLEEFLSFSSDFTDQVYNQRSEFEIRFQDFLHFLKTYFHLAYSIEDIEVEYQFSKIYEKLELVPDIVHFLKYCAENKIEVVALSNSTFTSTILEKQAQDLKIDKYFKKILSSADYVFRKPNTNFFKIGISCFNCEKKEILYIGNDLYCDIYGASKTGLNAIWFNEYNNNKSYTLCFHSYLDIIKYIQKERGVE